MGRIRAATESPTKHFAELVSLPNEEWAAATAAMTGKSKEKLLSALEWGRKELKGRVSETALKAITTIAADDEGALL